MNHITAKEAQHIGEECHERGCCRVVCFLLSVVDLNFETKMQSSRSCGTNQDLQQHSLLSDGTTGQRKRCIDHRVVRHDPRFARCMQRKAVISSASSVLNSLFTEFSTARSLLRKGLPHEQRTSVQLLTPEKYEKFLLIGDPKFNTYIARLSNVYQLGP